MRRTGMIFKLLTAVGVCLSVFLLSRVGMAVEPPIPFGATLYFTNTTYNLDDPNTKIEAILTLKNTSGAEVLTQEGFSGLNYHLNMYFYGPEGTDAHLITPVSTSDGESPTPGTPPPLVPFETLAAGWSMGIENFEVRDYYPLTQPGQYKVWFSMPAVQYDGTEVQPRYDSDGIYIGVGVPSTAVIWQGIIDTPDIYITLTRATPAVTADIRVTATEFKFGEGTRPGVTKSPLTQIGVIRLYKKTNIEEQGITTINHQTYGAIATNPSITYQAFEPTDTPGEYLKKGVEQSDYVIIAYPNQTTDFKPLGKLVAGDDPDWGMGEIFKNLILMTDFRGKKSPGKSKKITGSELLIIEPEYVEWTSDEELYVFVFESVGDWGVTVDLEPPEGFVADEKRLDQYVSSELKAIQFTLTDEGTKWKPTKVKYKLKHKGKTKKHESEIDIKLSRKKAKEKGVGVWGEKDKKKP